jgi:histone H3/H4
MKKRLKKLQNRKNPKRRLNQKSKMVDLIVKSKIKEAVPDLQVAAEVAEALNKKVEQLLKDGAERAKANGRRTLQGRDL